MRRVVVTGIGVISGLGKTREAFRKALYEGRCGMGPITNTECFDLRFRSGAEVKDYEPTDYFSPKEADMSRKARAARALKNYADIDFVFPVLLRKIPCSES